MRIKTKRLTSIGSATAIVSALSSCGTDPSLYPPPPTQSYCPANFDLDCQGIVESGGSVSGITRLDAFFVAALKWRGRAREVQAEVANGLSQMATALGLDASGSAAEVAARIGAHVESRYDGKLDGALTIVFEESRCEVSSTVAVLTAARCDSEVDAAAVAECNGGCVIEPSAKDACKCPIAPGLDHPFATKLTTPVRGS